MFNTPPSSLRFLHKPRLTESEARLLIRRANAEWNRRIGRVSKFARENRNKKARSEVRHFLDSGLCKLAAMDRANRKMKKRLRTRDTTLIRMASTLNLWSRFPEPAYVHGIAKADGGMRPVVDFDLYSRAAQVMCKETLMAMHAHSFPEWQFGLTKGRDQCATALSSKITSGEFTHFAELDIENFYGSIDPSSLAEKEIGLPRAVILNVICANAYTYRCSKVCFFSGLPKACRLGIAQGSIVSPIVSALVVRKVMSGCEVRSLVNYADNFAILGTSTKDLMVQIRNLQAAFTSGSPYGTLRLGNKQEGPISAGWRFLGYDCTLNEEGLVDYEPCDRAFDKIRLKTVKNASELRVKGCRLANVRLKLNETIERWHSGYPLTTRFRCSRSLDWLAEYLTSRISLKKLSFEQVCRNVQRYMRRVQRALSASEPFFFRHLFGRDPGDTNYSANVPL